MRVIIFLLIALLACPALSGRAAAAPRLAEDGKTLILEGASQNPKKDGKSEDTLYQLLGQEVQVYIFNTKSRVWPQPRVWPHVYVRSAPGVWRNGNVITPRDPRVEALIQKYAGVNGVDPSLVRAVIRHESDFNPGAVSPKGAQGLMQLMPGTAGLMGVRDPFDPEQNIAGGVGYLRHCLERFQHNVPLAVAAYNAGPDRVARCGTIPPIQETQLFVNNVMGSYAGPTQMANIPPDGKGAALPAKGSLQSRNFNRSAAAQPEAAKEVPRRPKAKIIEVRFLKKLPREAAD
jgi:hypothetical protein